MGAGPFPDLATRCPVCRDIHDKIVAVRTISADYPEPMYGSLAYDLIIDQKIFTVCGKVDVSEIIEMLYPVSGSGEAPCDNLFVDPEHRDE